MHYSPSTGGFYTRDIHGENIPDDAVEVTKSEHAALLAGQSAGKRIAARSDGRPELQDPPAPTFDALVAANTAAIQRELDRQAQAKGYDNIVSACTYAAQPVGAPFQAEGAAFLAWRSQVWTQAYATLALVQAGTATMPTPAEAVAAMPVLELPA